MTASSQIVKRFLKKARKLVRKRGKKLMAGWRKARELRPAWLNATAPTFSRVAPQISRSVRPIAKPPSPPNGNESKQDASVQPVLWGVDELAEITGGHWLRRPGIGWKPKNVRSTIIADPLADWLNSSIVFIDSGRYLKEWANHDVPQAVAAGCVAVPESLSNHPLLPQYRPVLAVPDVPKAIRRLSRAARDRFSGKIMLVTGTVGKTTTKSMLAHVLRARGATETTPGDGNFRVHTLQYMASANPSALFAAYELGLGGIKNSFSEVSEILRPHVVVLTQVDVAHLDAISENPLSHDEALAAVAEQKLLLANDLVPGGAVIVNADTIVFPRIKEILNGKDVRIVTFGTGLGVDFQLLAATPSRTGMRIEARAHGRRFAYKINLPGQFMAVNSLAAIAAACEGGLRPEDAAARLANFQAVPGRGSLLDLTIDGKPVRVIDDSFNATPISVRSTLQLLSESNPGADGRRIAVLGDIAHLGPESAAIHAGLAEVARQRGIDKVFTFGREMLNLQDALPSEMRGGHYGDRAALVDALTTSLQPGDVVTIKASAPAQFRKVIQALRERDVPAPQPETVAQVGVVTLPAPVRDPDMPSMSWLLSGRQGVTQLTIGSAVEELASGVFEGAWDGSFGGGRPDLAETIFGSGLIAENGRVIIVTPKHTLEGIYLLISKHSGQFFLSNSLVFALSAAGFKLRVSIFDKTVKIGKGFECFRTRVFENENFSLDKLIYYNYEITPDGSITRLPLPSAREFQSYVDYRTALGEVIRGTVANAADPSRRKRFSPLTTVSSGYDSSACAALAKEVGCSKAITIRTARGGAVDSGRKVAEVLGLQVIERERPDFPEQPNNETFLRDPAHFERAAEFFACGMGADDVLFLPFEDVLRETVLFTGFHGDKFWDLDVSPSTDAKRGDVSGSSLMEFRSRLGFINVPVPYIFVRSHESLIRIGRSEEMAAYHVPRAYNRPVPRRIAEDAGVPRGLFGRRKRAACVLFNGVDGPFVRSLPIIARRYVTAVERLRSEPEG